MEEFEMRQIGEEASPAAEDVKNSSDQEKKKMQLVLLTQYYVVYSVIFEYFDRIFVRERIDDTDGLVEMERGHSRWRCFPKVNEEGQKRKRCCGKTDDDLVDLFLWLVMSFLLLVLTGCIGYLGFTYGTASGCKKS